MCTTGCRTKDHASYADCLRDKNPQAWNVNSASGHDYTAEKAHRAELQAYVDARAQGIQPSGTKKHQVEAAIAISNETGSAYQA